MSNLALINMSHVNLHADSGFYAYYLFPHVFSQHPHVQILAVTEILTSLN